MADDEQGGGIAQKIDEDLPWTEGTLALVHKIQQAKTKEERGNLMVALANRIATENDSTDETATDDYHDVIDDFCQARLRYQQSALRVARLTVDLVQRYADAKDTTVEKVTEQIGARTTSVLN